MRLCTCPGCSRSCAIDPVTNAMYRGQYVSDVVFKEHRRADLAQSRGASHLEGLRINLPQSEKQEMVGPHRESPLIDLSSPVSPVAPANVADKYSPPPRVAEPVTSDDVVINRLWTIHTRLDETNSSDLLETTNIVFCAPPSRRSPPMLVPSLEQLTLKSDIPSNASVVEFEKWLKSAMELAETVSTGDFSIECRTFAAVLFSRAHQEDEALLVMKMMQYEKLRKSVLLIPSAARRVDTLNHISRPFRQIPPQLLLSYLLIACLHLIAGVSLQLCKFFLLGLRKASSLNPYQAYEHGPPIHLEIPRDVETVISHINLEPTTRAYACCPTCFTLYRYRPDLSGDLPEVCSFKKTPSSRSCGALLTMASRHRIPVPKPIRVYLHHELEDYISGLYSRFKIEETLDRDVFPSDAELGEGISDILHSPALRQFLGPEGDPQRPFLKRPGSEGRLAFSLNMDGFNPLMNKESGKKISVGAIYMVCLHLPPAIRYDLENVFIVGIIPGPNEPSKEEINHVIEPLVDDLMIFWLAGFFLICTSHYPHGRLVRGALIPLICDLPAARQMSGFAGHQSSNFCSFCLLKLANIDNFNYECWPRRSEDEHRRLAEEWRNSPSELQRDALFKRSGIRWSQLLRLPYWDPTKFVMIDPMHGFFLRIFQRHCRQVWGMSVDLTDGDHPSSSREKDLPSNEEMENGYRALRHGSEEHLSALKAPVLRELGRLTGSIMYGGRMQQLVRDLVAYRKQKGWFNADGQVIPHAQAPSAQEFLNSQNSSIIVVDPPHPQRKPNDPPTEVDIQYALHLLNHGTKSAIKRLHKVVLVALCERVAAQVDAQAVVAELVQALEAWRLNEGIIDTSGNLLDKTALVKPSNRSKKLTAVLGRETLREIRRDMAKLRLPSWVSPAPNRPGEAKTGKFTADQWRLFCTINLPITLNRLWGNEPENSRKRLMLDNFLHLITAVKLATMRRMTPARIAAYELHIHQYLTGLVELYPGTSISPYQHLALHFPECLQSFGPSHAWRCFRFERYNYLLQNIPTNFKLGELESTLLKRFCKGQNLRNLIDPDQDHLPIDLNDLLSEWDEILDDDVRGTRVGDNFAHNDQFQLDDSLERLAQGTKTPLPTSWYQLLRAHAGVTFTPSHMAYSKTKVKRCGQVFQTADASQADCNVYYQTEYSNVHAGVISGIFLTTNSDGELKLYFVVMPYVRLPSEFEDRDPYLRFPEVGGRLYRDLRGPEVLIAERDLLYHFAGANVDIPQIPFPCVVALPVDRI